MWALRSRWENSRGCYFNTFVFFVIFFFWKKSFTRQTWDQMLKLDWTAVLAEGSTWMCSMSNSSICTFSNFIQIAAALERMSFLMSFSDNFALGLAPSVWCMTEKPFHVHWTRKMHAWHVKWSKALVCGYTPHIFSPQKSETRIRRVQNLHSPQVIIVQGAIFGSIKTLRRIWHIRVNQWRQVPYLGFFF